MSYAIQACNLYNRHMYNYIEDYKEHLSFFDGGTIMGAIKTRTSWQAREENQ